MVRVLITGASGLLGRSVLSVFQNAGFECLGTCFSRVTAGLYQVDLGEKNQVDALFATFLPKIVIHCAAERRPDVSENNETETLRTNVIATENICNAVKKLDAWMLYISTDYVFDGTCPPYATDSATNPLNFYGKSKLYGEKCVLDILGQNSVVLRIPVLYGPSSSLSESAISVLVLSIISKKETVVDNFAVRFPTHTLDVAEICLKLASIENLPTGIFHFSSKHAATKWDIIQFLGENLNLDISHLKSDDIGSLNQVGRPKNAQLDCSKLESLGLLKELRSWKVELPEIVTPLLKLQ